MLIFPKAVNFYLGLDPVDMRKSINGLSMIVADILDQDPACGHVFIFINKTRKKTKTTVLGRKWLCDVLQKAVER